VPPVNTPLFETSENVDLEECAPFGPKEKLIVDSIPTGQYVEKIVKAMQKQIYDN
jgi:hypothetical protein